MPTEIKLWQIEEDTPESVDSVNIDLESRLENWIRQDINLVSDDFLVIGQQVRGIDILAMDSDADLVILELKRGKATREVVAQILDYASWAEELDYEDIEELTSDFFGGKKCFEQAFKKKFEIDFPEFVNSTQRMYIVASETDLSTEKIVGYLSKRYAVDINIATFAYFNVDGKEMIVRSMLLDEEPGQKRATARRGTKRRPPLTLEELRDLAEDSGVVDLWDKAVAGFRPISQGVSRSRSSLFFNGRPGPSGRRTARSFVSLFPGDSSREKGLAISLRREKLKEDFNLTVDGIVDHCGLSDDLSIEEVGTGSTYFFDADHLDRLIELLRNNVS